jgi:hypothetical protein
MTVVTINDRRSTLRAGVAAALLLLTLHVHARAQEVRKQENVALVVKEETVDSIQTGAGTLALVRVGLETDLQMELRLNGRKVADVEAMYAGFKAYFRELESGEVVVMWASEGGTACPAQFRVIRVVGEGKVTVTEEFGDCGDAPTITLQLIPEEEITFRFQGYYRLSQESEPGFRKPPSTTWVYKRGVIRELKPATKKRG